MHIVLQAPDGLLWGVAVEPGDYFWWNEGNMSCDCNRTLEVDRLHGTSYDLGEEQRCGDTWQIAYVVGEWVDETI